MRRALLIALLPALFAACSSDSGKVGELEQQVGQLQASVEYLTATNHSLESALKEYSHDAKRQRLLSGCIDDLTLTLQEVGAAVDHINRNKSASSVAKVNGCGLVLSTHQQQNVFASVQEVNQLVKSSAPSGG